MCVVLGYGITRVSTRLSASSGCNAPVLQAMPEQGNQSFGARGSMRWLLATKSEVSPRHSKESGARAHAGYLGSDKTSDRLESPPATG